MVGVDYWYMPTFAEFHHAYGAMVGDQPALALGAPARRGARSRGDASPPNGTRSNRRETRSATSCATPPRASTRREQSFTIIDQDLLVQARRSLDATQAEYAAGHGDAAAILDALRSYLQVRIERVRALAELASSQADLERAAGTLAVEGGKR